MSNEPEAYYDYAYWLCKKANAVMVWNNFYVGRPNEVQYDTLKLLSNTYDITGQALYKGEIYEQLNH